MSTCYIDGIGTAAADRVTVEALAADQQDVADLSETVGLEARHAPARDITPFGLAVDASHAALASSGLEPQDIDLIVQVGRMRVEYFSWGLSMAVAKELGHTTALCLDVTEWSGPSLVAGLRLLDAKFRTNDRLRTALLVFPHRFSDFVDLETPENRWLWPLSDGAGALVLRRGNGPGTPLGHAFASDGTAARRIGMRTEVVDDGPEPDGFFHHEWALAKYYFLRDPEGWPSQFEARVTERLADTIERAASRAALELDDLGAVQTSFRPGPRRATPRPPRPRPPTACAQCPRDDGRCGARVRAAGADRRPQAPRHTCGTRGLWPTGAFRGDHRNLLKVRAKQ